MADFPQLKTGAVLQYPAERSRGFATRVARFVDGSEQRYREQSIGLRRWIVRLGLLSDAEMAVIEEFVLSMQGATGEFTFTDPWDGTMYTHCSFEGEELELSYSDVHRGQVALVIRENRN